MIKLKYKSWEDITIPIYQEIIDIAKGVAVDEDMFSEREVDILAVLCDSDRESLGNIRIEDYAKLAHEARYLHKMPAYVPPSTITLRGVEYKVMTNIDKFTLAQYTEYNALRADVNTNISSILACLIVPTSAKGYADGYDVSEVVSVINAELPYYKAYGILYFFQRAQQLSFASSLCWMAVKMLIVAMFKRGRAERKRMRSEALQLLKASTSLGRCLLRALWTTRK